MTRADTIARLVNAYTDALGVVISNTVGYMAAANSLDRGDIQRDLHAAMEQSRQHLHLAFLECLGGAAVAGEAAGPWVVRAEARPGGTPTGYERTDVDSSFTERLPAATRFATEAEARERAAKWAPQFSMVEGWNDAGGRSVLVRSGVVVASAEWGRPGNWAHWLFPDGRQGGVTTTLDEARAAAEAAFPPEPPKPAGWVIEDRADVQYRWRGNSVRVGGGNWRPLVAEVVPFATESEAREAAKRLAHIDTRVLPVDAAGNVIEAEDIGATLRREECERKAARQSGVAWEAARAGEEAERLRGELAAVKAERGKVLANAATLDASLRRLRADRDEVLTERADLRITLRAAEAERDAARTELAAVKAERDKVLSNAAVLDTSLRRLRTDHATTLADRDALAAEVARLKAILECGSSPYGMHRCCHCDSEVT